MRDLLIRIDERVKGIGEKLDRMDRRADDHERRIVLVEHRIQDIEAKDSTNRGWLEWAWRLFGTPATVLIGFLILLYGDSERQQSRADATDGPAASHSTRH